MSEKLCALRKIGGGTELKETTLWTNPNPNTSQSSQTVTLNGNISNFDLIKITYRPSTTDTTELSVYCDDITKSISSSIRVACIVYNASNRGYYCRGIDYSSDTSLYIGYAGRVDASGSDASRAIVTTICGVKL